VFVTTHHANFSISRILGLPVRQSFLQGYSCHTCFSPFRSLADSRLLTTDDAILVELGNSAGYSEDDKPRFVAGLKNVLQSLRAKKTKDFKVIASEIAAYRASFLGDKSKVLLLDDSPK
jgi:hypothetical protein